MQSTEKSQQTEKRGCTKVITMNVSAGHDKHLSRAMKAARKVANPSTSHHNCPQDKRGRNNGVRIYGTSRQVTVSDYVD